jgi:ABC-type multidrug transport system fused ATPase/permease subunit
VKREGEGGGERKSCVPLLFAVRSLFAVTLRDFLFQAWYVPYPRVPYPRVLWLTCVCEREWICLSLFHCPLSYLLLLSRSLCLAWLPYIHPHSQLKVVKGNITFDHVRFSYDDFKTTVLKDLTFEVGNISKICRALQRRARGERRLQARGWFEGNKDITCG